MGRHEFAVWFTSEDEALSLYAGNAEQAADVMKKLTYSGAPIRFVELETKAGDPAFVNLANVTTVMYLGEVQS